MAMLKDYYVTYQVDDVEDGETLFTGGQNLAAQHGNDAIQQVEAMFGRYGKVIIRDVEQISENVCGRCGQPSGGEDWCYDCRLWLYNKHDKTDVLPSDEV